VLTKKFISECAKNYLPIIISLFALSISILTYKKSLRDANIDNRIEVRQLISSAWDDLGGRPGTEYFPEPISPES